LSDSEEQLRIAHLREFAKRELRSRMRAVRKVLPADAARLRSTAAATRVRELPEFMNARTVLGFSAIHKELDPLALLQSARAAGKRVALPRVDGERLDLHQVDDPADLVPGAFGVAEPHENAPRILPHEVDLVLVPGLAFDARGHRLGYGRGFYDRLLPLLTRAFSVALGYDFQLVAELPNEAHDVPVQCIVSDARCLRIDAGD
jgi:5-formyltetrahydrofolate cyclo-ligase